MRAPPAGPADRPSSIISPVGGRRRKPIDGLWISLTDFVLSMVYAEAVFVLLVAGCLLTLMNERCGLPGFGTTRGRNIRSRRAYMPEQG
jgi:hypothetical protein